MFMQSRRNLNIWTPSLILKPCEQREVIGTSTLKLFVLDCLVVLSVVFTDTWIVFTDYDIIVSC